MFCKNQCHFFIKKQKIGRLENIFCLFHCFKKNICTIRFSKNMHSCAPHPLSMTGQRLHRQGVSKMPKGITNKGSVNNKGVSICKQKQAYKYMLVKTCANVIRSCGAFITLISFFSSKSKRNYKKKSVIKGGKLQNGIKEIKY